MKYEFKGDTVKWTTGESFHPSYYTTNGDGEGIFHVDIVKNERRQLAGTCDFSLRGLTQSAARAKIRKAMLIKEDDA